MKFLFTFANAWISPQHNIDSEIRDEIETSNKKTIFCCHLQDVFNVFLIVD